MKHHLAITADNHFTLKLTYSDSDGQPINLTNATARFMLRRSMYSPTLIEKSLIIDAATSELTLVIPPEDTKDILDDVVAENFIYGIQLTLEDGTTTILLDGDAEITQSIVRD